MDIQRVCDAISEEVDAGEVLVEKVEYEESDPALDLYEGGEIGEDELYTKFYLLDVFSDDVEIADIVLAEMPQAMVAYVSDFEIAPAYRSQGEGTRIHSAIVSSLEEEPGIERVFVVPTNEAMERIVRKNEFEEVDGERLESWFVKTV